MAQGQEGRPTKKALNEALKPLYAAYDRFALGLTTGGTRVARPQPIEWNGLTIDIQLIRRSRVLCGVPFPQAVMEFHYEAFRDGQRIVSWSGRPSFIDAVFRALSKEPR